MGTESSFSFITMEHSILEFWKKHKVFEESIAQTAGKDPYTFYDGPPFATGLPHHGHLLASTIKDIIPRYQTMKGFFVERRFGWDCHGLPIEHEINKQLNMDASQAVKELGIAGYNQACRNIVMRYREQWYKTVNRIGRWVDFENDYKTMDADFMESVWWTFNQLWDKGLIYHGTKVVPYSTVLETPLSNFEASSNYQDVQNPSIVVKLYCKATDDYLLIWTTTPWTLPSNLAVAVNPKLTYLKIKNDKNEHFIIAKDRVEAYFKPDTFTTLESCTGAELEGRTYQPLFPELSQHITQATHKVIIADFVTASDGTGLVHCAPAFGEDDFIACKENGITEHISPIDKQCRFTSAFKPLEGVFVKDADKEIIKILKNNNALLVHSTIVHSYPHCPRSDTPLIYRSTPSWYLNVEKIKDRMIKHNQSIHWTPQHIQNGRFGKWLEGAKDWALSRNRVWGCPIPIWINDTTGKKICIESIEALKKLTNITLTDLHREHVDPLTFTLKDEPGTYRRTSEVFDCWFESGAMPYAQLHYPFERQERFEKGYPADFIAEGVDQTRGWFYTLIVLSTALFDVPAFKNIIVSGIVLANDGKKMSKRLKNYTAPDELMETYGADALRLYLIHSGLVKAEEQRFDDSGVKDMIRKTLLPWYNAFKFLKTYANVDKWTASFSSGNSDHILDQWILSRLETLKGYIDQHMTDYELYLVVPALLSFLDELTNTYIRLNRQRYWTDTLSDDKIHAYQTLYTVVHDFSVCMAPFTPFLAEHIYQELSKLNNKKYEKSVHLKTYPKAHAHLCKPLLEDAVSRLQEILLLGRQARNTKQIKVKIPLSNLTIYHSNLKLLDEIKLLEPFITRELNVKKVTYSIHESDVIELYAKPNAPVLGKKLGKDYRTYQSAIQSLNNQQLKAIENGNSITILDQTFEPHEILIFRQTKENSQALSNKLITIELDDTLNDELIEEGIAREVINRIQRYRKQLQLNVDDRIQLTYCAQGQLDNAIQKHFSYIKQETLTLSMLASDTKQDEIFEINDLTLSLSIKVVEHNPLT